MSLYLKYRPRTIDQLDLEEVRKTLTEMVKFGEIGHAYLLTGPRGAGKTSTARILARIVNCEKNGKKLGEPCNECSACTSILDGSALDVIEIDAASNRGIDDIRELKEKIRLAPSSLSKKVYIIDEVHMLTSEAFNALLKTLEEPPSHSLFILCTTELHKVPETIVSRCTEIQFSKASPGEMQRAFLRVVSGEGKGASEEALSFLARSVDGSFRDGVKILDQALSGKKKIELADLEVVVMGSARHSVLPLVSALVKKDLREAIAKLSEAFAAGVDVTYLLTQLMRTLRDALLSKWGIVESPLAEEVGVEVVELIYRLDSVASKLSGSLDAELLLQTIIVEWCTSAEAENNQAPASRQGGPNNNNQKKKEHKESSKNESGKALDGQEVWQKLLDNLNGDSVTLGTLLSKAGPTWIKGDELTITVPYDFHRQQIMSEKVLSKLELLVSETVGRAMKIKCEVGQVTSVEKLDPDDTIAEAVSIFSS